MFFSTGAQFQAAITAIPASQKGSFVAFDEVFYKATYMTNADTLSAIDHFVTVGAAKNFKPTASFDPVYYATKFSDLSGKGFDSADLLIHFLRFGLNEGRSPNTALNTFDGAAYLAANADVAAFVNANLASFNNSTSNGALAHFVKFGAAEGRAAPLTGQTFTLTTGTDSGTAFTGSANNDAFTAVNSSLLTEGTLQGADTLDGGAGTADSLTVSMKQDFGGFTTGSMKSIEIVNLKNANAAAANFSAAGVTGVTKYVIDGSVGSTTLSNLDALAALEVSGPANTGVIAAVYAATSVVATGSQTDVQSLKVTNVGTINSSTTATSNAKASTVTIAKVETLAIETVGTANTLNLAGVVDAKSITLTGAGQTEITAVGTAVTSFDASTATGNTIANLTGASSNALATVKTGGGNDSVTVQADDLTAGATISGGAGTDTLVIAAGAGKTLQATMTGFETLSVGNITSALIFSGTNVSDLATINVQGLTTAAASFVNSKATALTLNSIGANTQAIAADNAAAVIYNLNAAAATVTAGTASDANSSVTTFSGATTLAVNVGSQVAATGAITAAAATAVAVNVTGKVVSLAELSTYGTGILTAGVATSLNVNSTGQLVAADFALASATTGTIVAGSALTGAADTVKLVADKMGALSVTAAQDFTFNAASSLAKLQTLTVSTAKAYVQGVDLLDAASVTVSGAAAASKATFSNLGAVGLTHNVDLTATGLKSGLTVGTITAGTGSSTINVSGVTGNVVLGNVSANTGITLNAASLGGTLTGVAAPTFTTTTGNISVDVSAAAAAVTLGTLTTGVTAGDVTVLATSAVGNVKTDAITGNNVTVNGQAALGTVIIGNGTTAGADINARTSVTYTGTNLQNNGVDIVTTAESGAFTATVNGGANNEVITITGNTKQTAITATGNLGAGANLVTVTLVNNTAATGAGATAAQTVNLSGLTSSAVVADSTNATLGAGNYETNSDLTAETNDNLNFVGSVKDDLVVIAASTMTVSVTDATSTDKDMLSLAGTFTKLTVTGIEGITNTGAADINASAISGKTIAITNGANVLTVTGSAVADVIDLSKITHTGAATALVVTGLAGNDTIIGTANTDTINGGAGADTMTGGGGADRFVFTTASTGLPSTTNFDIITDYSKVAGTTFDTIAAGNLIMGTQAGVAGAGVATISAGGVATFNIADTTFAAHLTAVVAALGNNAGETAVWQEGANSYMYISDGTAGVSATDVLIQLTGVTSGALTIAGNAVTAMA